MGNEKNGLTPRSTAPSAAAADTWRDHLTTSSSTVEVKQPTLDELMQGMLTLLEQPRPIGSWMGFPVCVDPKAKTIEIRAQPAMAMPINHPYLIGTKINDDACRAIGVEPPKS